MILFSRDFRKLINTDNVTDIFAKDLSIKVNFVNGTGSQLETYDNPEYAKTAMKIISEKMDRYKVMTMPTEKEINAVIQKSGQNEKLHNNYANGQKRKRTGGS